MKNLFTFTFIFIFISVDLISQNIGEELPKWEEGYLDIHHINTGRGDCTFFILPDGTTMIIDAGDHNRPDGPREFSILPNDKKTPGEWIVKYIKFMIKNINTDRIDYLLLTHFHSDHMGSFHEERPFSSENGFVLSGVSDVGFRLPIDKIVDRAWPNYNWPKVLNDKHTNNYRKFLEWTIEEHNTVIEQFEVGSNHQFKLVNNNSKYLNFEIRNIAANGIVWTGVNRNTRNFFPEIKNLNPEDYPTENMCSTAIRLSYGKFDYFTGGDMPGLPMAGSPGWQNIEKPVGKAVGPVEVHVANHHGYIDAASIGFLRNLKPQVNILQTYVVSQPGPKTLERMLSQKVYKGPREIFATNLSDVNKIFIGNSSDNIKGGGHIVVRVSPGGRDYKIIILDDQNETDYRIKSVHGPYFCD